MNVSFGWILSQIFVVFALVFAIISMTTNNKLKAVLFNTFCTAMFLCSYFCLKEYAGVASCVIGVVRGIWFYINDKSGRENDLISLITISALLIVSGFVTFDNWYSILPILATLNFTIGIWQPKINIYRMLSIITSLLFITYNIMITSYTAILFESIMIVVEVISLINYYKDLRKNNIDK